MRPRKAAADALRLAAARAAGRSAPAFAATAPAGDIAPRPARRAHLSARARLPELVPADHKEERRPFVGIDMRSDAVQEEETRFAHRAETRSEVARLTVYAMNATLMIMAFPVGFALLVFNILGGENLRTTAHAMALTGLGIALSGVAGVSTGAFGIL
jgi:hypothetical protein